MGQYYHIALEKNGILNYNSRKVRGCDYIMAKLCEHSYLGNSLMDAVAKELYGCRCRLAWVGDYSEQDELDEITKGRVNKARCWGEGDKEPEQIPLGENEERREFETAYMFNYDGKYFVNWDKKVAISFDKIRTHYSKDADLIYSPVSILTAVGNGRGGGDYGGKNEKKVGTWAWDEISIENNVPDGFKVLDIYFKDNWMLEEEKELKKRNAEWNKKSCTVKYRETNDLKKRTHTVVFENATLAAKFILEKDKSGTVNYIEMVKI